MRKFYAVLFRVVVAAIPGAWLRAALTRLFPCRVIQSESGPYLSRWTLRKRGDGGHDYLHFFHCGDKDRDLHDHPWSGRGVVLAWGYREERRFPMTAVDDIGRFTKLGEQVLLRSTWVFSPSYAEAEEAARATGYAVLARDYRFGDETEVSPGTFHRVDLLRPDRGCWTYISTSARSKSWGFWNRCTGALTPWGEYLAHRGIPTDGDTRPVARLAGSRGKQP